MLIRRFLFIPFLMLSVVFSSFVDADHKGTPDDVFVVVLDAGHGGHDPGNLGNGYMEKNIALSIVLEIGEYLSQYPDIQVVYTRKDDSFVDLFVRGEIANKANADLFVSVHCDSHSSDAHGAGTFVLGLHANEQNFEIAKKENSVIYLEDNYESRYAEYDINSPESIIGLTIMQEEFLDQSIMLAKMMQENFSGKLKRNDRKVKQAGFIVLHQTFMPSVLIETGFLTNKAEGTYLNSSKGQLEIGKAIADAIIKYKNNLQGSAADISRPSEAIVGTVPEKAPPLLPKTVKKEVQKPAMKEKATAQIKEPSTTEIATAEQKTAEFMIVEDSPKVVEDSPKIVSLPKGSSGTPAQKQADIPVTKQIEEKKEAASEVAGKDMAPPKKEDQKNADASEKVLQKEGDVVNELKEAVTVGEKSTPEVKGTTENIIFKVQLLASSRDMPLRPEDFKGLNKLSKEPYKNLYRYMYGSTNSYTEAKLMKTNADVKGYISSYIVAYKEGVRIPVQEALKYVSE